MTTALPAVEGLRPFRIRHARLAKAGVAIRLEKKKLSRARKADFPGKFAPILWGECSLSLKNLLKILWRVDSAEINGAITKPTIDSDLFGGELDEESTTIVGGGGLPLADFQQRISENDSRNFPAVKWKNV